MTEKEQVQEIWDNTPKVYNKGVDDARNRFTEAYQKNGNETYYTYHYAGNGWTDETYSLYGAKYPIKATSNAAYMFYASWVSDTIVDIYLGSGNTNCIFHHSRLVTIRKIHVTKETRFNSNCFQQCANLVNITFEGLIPPTVLSFEDSQHLSKDSITNIMTHLDNTGIGGGQITFSHLALQNAFGSAYNLIGTEWERLVLSNPYWNVLVIRK